MSESSSAGTPSMLICVWAEASMLSGSGETVTRAPARAADTFRAGGTQAIAVAAWTGAAQQKARAASVPARAAASALVRTTGVPVKTAGAPSPLGSERGACRATSVLDRGRGGDYGTRAVKRLHGHIRTGARRGDRGLKARLVGGGDSW